MKPTIGRIVHFTAPSDEGGETYAGMITAVLPSGAANLVTFGPTSLYFHQGIPISESDGAEPTPGCWNWPPRV